jgi:hypothetical protein
MKTWIVRKSLDYSTLIVAETEIEALRKADKLMDSDWGKDMSELEAEEAEDDGQRDCSICRSRHGKEIQHACE